MKEYFGVSDWMKIEGCDWKYSLELDSFLAFGKNGHAYLTKDGKNINDGRKSKTKYDKLDTIQSIYGHTDINNQEMKNAPDYVINKVYDGAIKKDLDNLPIVDIPKLPKNTPPIIKQEFLKLSDWKERNFQDWLDENHPEMYKTIYGGD